MSLRSERANQSPGPLNGKDGRVVAWTVTLIVLGGYVVWQLLGVATVKDAVPPAWLITVPTGASMVGESRIGREPYRATTYVTIRPANGQNHVDLMDQMGLSEQPTQIGSHLLDWRAVWVYGLPVPDGVEFRLVYLRDTGPGPAP